MIRTCENIKTCLFYRIIVKQLDFNEEILLSQAACTDKFTSDISPSLAGVAPTTMRYLQRLY
jgi:hypothetical protein